MTYDALYIDVINLYYKAYYGYRKEEGVFRGRSFKKQGIRGLINKINYLIDDLLNDNGKVYLCIDNFSSRVTYRKTIDENYKANRKIASSDFYESFRLACLILKNYNSDFVYCVGEGLEADDLLPYLISKNTDAKTHLVVSSDMDWARVISHKEGCHVDWHNGKELVSVQKFEDKYGFFPDEDTIIAYKCFRGDPSDNIKAGWPRIQEETLLELLEFGSMEDIIEGVDYIDCLSEKQRKKLRKCIPDLRKNLKLVSFLDVKDHSISCERCKYNPRMVNKVLKTIGLISCMLSEKEYKQVRLL